MCVKQLSWKHYGLGVLLTESAGGLSGWLTRQGAARYARDVVKPPLTPPPVVFPVVWALLFALMGMGGARVWRAPESPARTRSLILFFLQLAFNFSWSLLFFNLRRFGLALLWLAGLWGLILGMICSFRQVDRLAAWLQIPYLLWVTFAAYLNLGVWTLNRWLHH